MMMGGFTLLKIYLFSPVEKIGRSKKKSVLQVKKKTRVSETESDKWSSEWLGQGDVSAGDADL